MIFVETKKYKLTTAGEKEFVRRAAGHHAWRYALVHDILKQMRVDEKKTGIWFAITEATTTHHNTAGDSKLKPMADRRETPRYRLRREREEK